MNPKGKERRAYSRYDTEAKIYFRVSYELTTKLKFQVIDERKKNPVSPKYVAVSKNLSAGGLSFISDQKLKRGDILFLEVYPPGHKKPIPMQGVVRWSKALSPKEKHDGKFSTGILLLEVQGCYIKNSIHFDEKYQVIWSSALEAIFGSYRKFAQKQKKKNLS